MSLIIKHKKYTVDIKEINLINNQIQEIPKEIGNLTNLQILCLSDNKLKEIPKKIYNLLKQHNIEWNINNTNYKINNLNVKNKYFIINKLTKTSPINPISNKTIEK